MFKVGESEGAVEAVAVGSGPTNVTELGPEGLDLLEVVGVTGKFLNKILWYFVITINVQNKTVDNYEAI